MDRVVPKVRCVVAVTVRMPGGEYLTHRFVSYVEKEDADRDPGFRVVLQSEVGNGIPNPVREVRL